MTSWLSGLSFLHVLGYTAGVSVGLTLLSLLVAYPVQRSLQARGRKIFDLPLKRGQLNRELLGNVLWHLMSIPLFAWCLTSGVLRFGDGLAREAMTFFLCVYAFQALYWFLHRAMHWPPVFFVHKWHHDSLVTTPLTGFSMHPLEGLGWMVCFVGPAALVSLFTEVGFWGYLAFVAVAWTGNIVGHINAEMMPALSSTKWGSRLYGNPVSYHCLHHARFDGHYGFATSWMDAIFGTQWSDWVAVSNRVRGGEPLTKLRERVEAPRG